MSQLPDEVLVDILSWLSVNEAARTSVLSRRWRNLWKHIPSLNFDAQSALRNNLKNSRMRGKLIKSEGSKYVKWVNSVLQSHKSLTLKEFIIGFALDITAKHSINLWLHYAFARQVQRLELDFMCYCNPPSYYCFPEEFLPLSNCISPKLQTPSDIFWNHRPLMLDNFKSLKDLSFKSVNLSGEVIEFFLHNCRLLERLVVHRSHKISNLEVCGPSLRLKHLEIVHCFGLKKLKVSLPNLTSLRVKIVDELVLENVPMLVELSFSCNDIGMSVKGLMPAVSCCISQLEILRLELYTSKEINEIYKFPEMPKLKKLFILFDGDGCENLFRMTAFIKASPSLEEFELKYEWSGFFPRKDREIEDAITKSPHHHLKTFKFSGYYGRHSHAALLGYVLQNCSALEKIIIDPSGPCGLDKLIMEQTARKNAKQQLQPQIPQHVKLLVL